tara:strand:+ start:44 stop:469 length:426 start_codon:yes stop_codon:yes gene_type:complete
MKRNEAKMEPDFFIFQVERENNSGLFLLSEFEKLRHTLDILNLIDRLKINPEIGEKIALRLGLTFLEMEERGDNLCMANSKEVLPEFREICTDKDLRSYVFSILRSSDFEKIKTNALIKIKIPFPDNSKSFWALVEEYRQE